ncbi:MAG TPA: POTRA domain-containing protein [Rhizomicrobium sp.]
MTSKACMSLLAAISLIAAAISAAAGAPAYILNGYVINGLKGTNTDELKAKFKDKPGTRVTRADVLADQAILSKELDARHIAGHLFTGIAEKNGHIWVIFQVQHPGLLAANQDSLHRHIEAQSFEGATHIAPGALASATGLKRGDPLSPDKLRAARQAILAAYAKAMPGKTVTLKIKMQTRPGGAVTMIWLIGEPK